MINIFEPHLTNESLEAVNEVFESKWLGRGVLAADFEKSLADFLSVSPLSLSTMASCSDAIFAILRLLSKETGRRKVLVPSISFPAIGSAVIEAGLDLIIVDVEALTGNICLENLLQDINNNDEVLAVFITHYGGNPVDIEKLRDIVGNEIYILEDSACALGSVLVDGSSVGSKGDFSCWSFDAMKLLVAGEGGAARFNDPELLRRFKQYLYLGLPPSAKSGLDKANGNENWWSYQLNDFGRRSVFTNINAAIALPQFATLSEKLERRGEIREHYIKCIAKNTSLSYARQRGCSRYSNYFFTVLSERRDDLALFLKDRGVYTTFRYFPLHLIDLFVSVGTIGEMAGANSFSSCALNIPIHNGLTDYEVKKIGKLLQEF